MARAIDADALQELCDRRIQDTWNSGTAPVSWAHAYADFKDDIDSMPTLTPPNEPLTLEELREMDEPVWVACKPIEGGNGYWCLCQHGHIITPAGSIYNVKEIPHWVFYRRPPEGEDET